MNFINFWEMMVGFLSTIHRFGLTNKKLVQKKNHQTWGRITCKPLGENMNFTYTKSVGGWWKSTRKTPPKGDIHRGHVRNQPVSVPLCCYLKSMFDGRDVTKDDWNRIQETISKNHTTFQVNVRKPHLVLGTST